MDPTRLHALKKELKDWIWAGESGKAIEGLRAKLAHHSEKFNILIQLGGQFNKLERLKVKGTHSFEQIQIQESSLISNLLTLIDILAEDDFNDAPVAATSRRNSKIGSVLYSIPSKMEVDKERMCTVRLAFNQSFLLEDILEGQDTHIRSLRRIDKRMEVELVDPNPDAAFELRTISTPVQIVEKDDYTEWLFFVKPLTEGKFPLFLKISIITVDDEGEKIRKELILQEEIEVLTELPVEEPVGVAYRHSGFYLTIGLPAGIGGLEGTEQAPAADVTAEVATTAGALFQRATQFVASHVVAVVASLALVTAVVGGILYTQGQEQFVVDMPAEQPVEEPAKLAINEPFSNLSIEGVELIVEDPTQPEVFNLKSGAAIRVPANAFVDESGQPVTKRVALRFREFHDAAEIIVSGIPMHVHQQDGSREWLQTAGMFEIRGASQGKPVSVASGKAIEVGLRSRVGGEYHLWALDESQGSWVDNGPGAPPAPDEAFRQEAEQELSELRRKTANKPQNPADEDAYKLEFDNLDVSKCPGLAGEKKVFLTYAGNDAKKDPKNNKWISDKNKFYKRELLPTDQKGVYQLVLQGKSLYSIPVKVVLQGPELEKAKAKYQQLLAEYKGNLAALQDKEAILAQQAAFRRTMNLQAFGIYNHDVLWKNKDSVPLMADFDFDGLPTSVKEMVTVYLVTGDGRTVIGLPHYDWDKFRFSPGADNKIVAVLPQDKVAVFTQDDFKREQNNMMLYRGKEYEFDMQVKEQPVTSLESLKQLLEEAS